MTILGLKQFQQDRGTPIKGIVFDDSFDVPKERPRLLKGNLERDRQRTIFSYKPRAFHWGTKFG